MFCFSVKIVKHWSKLPREVVESLCLKIYRSQLHMVLGSLVLASAEW